MTIFRTRGAFILETALELEASRCRSSKDRLLDSLVEEDPAAHADLRIMLARTLHMSLRPRHPDLRSLHVFGSSLSAARPRSDIDLLVHVARRQSPAVRGLHRLNREVTEAYATLFGPLPAGFRLFQFHVVTDQDVEARKGFAALLSSVHMERLRLGAP